MMPFSSAVLLDCCMDDEAPPPPPEDEEELYECDIEPKSSPRYTLVGRILMNMRPHARRSNLDEYAAH
jgi:hypothetical protein